MRADASEPVRATLKLPVAVDRYRAASLREADHLADAGQHSADPRLRQRARPLQFDQQDLLHLSAPMLLRPPPQVMPAQQTRAIVIRAEISRTRMRNVNRDKWNCRL